MKTKEFEQEASSGHPEMDLGELGKTATAYPELNYNRLQSQVPLEQPDSNLFSAIFFRDTTIGSFLARPEATAFDPDKNTNLDFMKFVPRRHKSQFDAYALVTNDEEAFSVMRSVDEENERTRMVSENPWKTFFYNFGLQPIDPVNALLPGSVIFRNVKSMSATAKAALQAGAAGTVSSAAQEAFIQGHQLTRSIDESIMNPLVSGLFSAVVGGAASEFGPKAKAMTAGVRDRAKRELLNVYTDQDGPKLTPYGPAGSGGSMGHLDDNTLANMPVFVQKGMITSLMNRMMSGEYQASKDVAADLFQNNYTLLKHEKGRPSGRVEDAMKLDISKASRVLIDYQNIFFDQAGVKKGFLAETRANKAAKNDPTGSILNWEKFDSDVAYTLVTETVHENEGVNKAAKLIRDQLFDPWKDAAIELGMLPEGVTPENAFGYFTVDWNQQKIKEDPGGFDKLNRDWFTTVNDVVRDIRRNKDYKAVNAQIKEANAILKKAKAEKNRAEVKRLKTELEALQKKANETAKEIAGRTLPEDGLASIFHSDPKKKGKLRPVLDPELIEHAVIEARQRITGNADSRLTKQIVDQLNRKGSRFRERMHMIPQRLAFDWQNKSASGVAQNYIRAMVPAIRMAQMAREKGYKNIAEWHDSAIDKLRTELHLKLHKSSIEDAAKALEKLKRNAQEPGLTAEQKAHIEKQIDASQKRISKRSPEKDAKANAKADAEFKKQSNNITEAFELLLGIYGDGPNILDDSAAKYYKAFLNWNYIRLLGFMTLSSIPDVGLHVLTHGPFSAVYDGLRVALGEMFGIMKDTTKDDLQAIGYACNTELGTRLKALSGHEGTSKQPSFLGRNFDKMVEGYGNVTLMNQWNDGQQRFAGRLSINRTLKAAEAHVNGTLSQSERTRLARLGLGEADLAILHDLWLNNGARKNGGTYFADWIDWDIKTKEQAAVLERFQRAVASEIDSTVIVPGLGDKPQIAHSNWGKLLLQFKSFAFAATNKILFAGIQRRHDMNTYFGMATMLAMGGLSYVVSQAVRGNTDIDLSFDKLAHEAIDRSGLLGIVSEVYNIAQKAGLGFGTQASRYQSRGLWSSLLGPSTGPVEEMLGLVNKMRKVDGEHPLTTKDFEKLLRLAPYRNLFYIYFLSRKVSGAAAKKLGFEEVQDSKLKEMFK